jgi:glycosyltransferase involved in cell wall biosynthesis
VLNFHPWIFFLYLARPFGNFKIIYSPQDNPFASKEAYQPVLNFLERAFVRRADGVIAYSAFVARALTPHVAGEVGVMHAGIYPQVYGIFEKEFNRAEALDVLFFGRIEPYKGVDVLLDAYLLLREKDRPIHLTIAGRGNIPADFSQKALAAGVDLKNYWLSGEELGGLIKDADVIVAPYTDATQSGVVITAISYLVPVIATRVGALPEYVEDGEGGFLVPPGDAPALATAIGKFIDDRSLAAAMSRHQEAVREAFSWKNISRSAIARYRSLLE